MEKKYFLSFAIMSENQNYVMKSVFQLWVHFSPSAMGYATLLT